ncbi:Bug family tripartite tricarboxylate transporter substrate binding protein [Belnapia rosea]|uniref:Tripartite-type tricarboxylate transporter, receptor component TctC n=1 Tax=Belnapia rosea TaxID=938405 RepID=A0A1G7DL37_9PROT|nr:tripartite tricarboxylate transporter substrate binding protein [Belnapia rosea]SDE52238.1 Tripartite-type tricarboxylate transporter, receptor component TctC [Belnapia rosea]
MRRIGRVLLLVMALAAITGQTSPQTAAWPTQPVRMVVAFPPGGATDVMARLLAQRLTAEIGQNVIVENRAGASGIVGSEAVAKAAPDGYTLLFAPSSHATLSELYPSLPFDPVRGFTSIATFARTPYLFVVSPGVPAQSMQELIELARRHPGEIAYASTGMGTAQHLAGEMLRRVAGIDILHVPYKGSGAVRADLLAGRIQSMFDNVAVMLPYVRRGEVRALAVTGPKRSPLVPNLPTLRELGLQEAEIEGWFVLLGPAGMPDDTVRRLNAAVNAVVSAPSMVEQLAELGAEALVGRPGDVTALIVGDRETWGRVIRGANIRVE